MTEPVRLMRRRQPAEAAVTDASLALFRLGEQCNNRCPMCSNSGRPEAFFQGEAELLRRADLLADRGFRRVVLTGGEPTIHPAFWAVVQRLGERGVAWDINTHGRSFADPAFTERALLGGLRRAIVSLHSHRPEAARVISGFSHGAFEETVAGLDQLVRAGAWLMINCVLTTHNLDVADYLRFCAARFGSEPRYKLVFPSTGGKGGDWEGIQLRLNDVRGPVAQARAVAAELGLRLAFESLPNCVLDDPSADDTSRSGFGETHYLDDLDGERLYPIRAIEAALSAFPDSCRGCRALPRCPGVAESYLRRHGASELTPFR